MSVGGAAPPAVRSGAALTGGGGRGGGGPRAGGRGAALTGGGERGGGMPRGRRSNRPTRCCTNTMCTRDGRGGLMVRASYNSPLMAPRAFLGRPHTATRTKPPFFIGLYGVHG